MIKLVISILTVLVLVGCSNESTTHNNNLEEYTPPKPIQLMSEKVYRDKEGNVYNLFKKIGSDYYYAYELEDGYTKYKWTGSKQVLIATVYRNYVNDLELEVFLDGEWKFIKKVKLLSQES